jgi:endoglucanase
MDRQRGRPRRASRILVLAVLWVAGAVLPAAPATAAETRVATAEAEHGVLDGWFMRNVADATAGNGTAVRYDWAGTVRLEVSLPAAADTLTLRVRGDRCAGDPAYTLTVDNAPVGGNTVGSTSWVELSHGATLPTGTHSVEVRFTNDHLQFWPPACDRNLYLDAVTFSASGSAPRAGNPPVPAGFVHQSGTRLLDGAGRPLRLRGVNLGGWLIWEGWLWGQGFDYIGESAMMSNLTSLVGSARAEQFRSDIRANFITAADFEAMAAYRLNVARVPFNYRLLEDDSRPFTYKASGWETLDRTVRAAKAHGVYLVLDMHAAPCSQMYAFVSDYVGPDFLWSSKECQDRMVAMWKAIAARYADENIIAGYDLLGETIIGDQQLLDLYRRTTAAIRSVDRNHTLIYEGNYMAREFDLFTAPLDANQLLSFHDYPWAFPGQDITARMAEYDAAARRLNTPQWAGEFGQSIYGDVEKYVDAFDRDPLMAGWALWVWKQVPGFAPVQAIRHTAASKKLVEWMNSPSRPRPTDAEATQGMADFVRAVRFEHTVHDARLRGLLDCEHACTAPDAGTADGGADSGRGDAPAGDPSAPSTGTATPLAASVVRAPLAVALRRGVRLRLTAPGPGRLTGTATRTGRVVARGAAVVTAAGRSGVTLRFSRIARKALRRARRVTLSVQATYAPARGAPVSQRQRILLTR